MAMQVYVIDDADMPAGHDWVRFDKGGKTLILFRASVVQRHPHEVSGAGSGVLTCQHAECGEGVPTGTQSGPFALRLVM